MKKPKCALLNFVVSLLAVVAVAGYFVLPLFEFSAKITFNEDIARLILTDKDAEKSEEGEDLENEDEDILDVLIKELTEEEITLEFTFSIDTIKFAETAFAMSEIETKKFLYSIIDDLVASLNKDALKNLEDSIARASVSAAIKVELKEMAKNQDKEIENVMDELGIDDTYLDNSTNSILSAIEDENATVDSVATVIVDVVKDVYDKYGNSDLADETFEHLTEENEEELKAEIADIISQFANEDGTFNGDGLISSLIEKLLSAKDSIENEEENEEENEAFVTSSQNLSFIVTKYFNPIEEEETEVKSIEEKIAEAIKASITDEICETAKIAILAIACFIAFCAFWWAFLLLKIIIKMGGKNPLVKLKAPIIFGGLPFIILALLPTVAITIIQTSPSFIHDLLDAETLATLTSIFGKAVELKFASSSVVAFVCGFILFIFGFHYANKRKSIKRVIKQRKRAAKKSAKLY